MSYENPRKRGLGFFRGRGGQGAKRARPSFSPQKRSLPRDDCETLRLTEKDLGITEYISKYPGFSGVIKQRFSDFLVNELKPDGSEVHLTDTTPPPLEEPFTKPSPEEMSDVLPTETWDKINALLEDPNGSVEILVTEKSKDQRRELHQLVKKIYGNKLASNTLEKGTDKYITVMRPGKDGNKRNNRPGTSWPYNKPEYVHFALYKENMDTMESVNLLAYKLFLKPGLLTYAGTKDRRAKTCQRVSVKKVDPSKIASVARTLRGIAVGNFEFNEDALRLGQLAGNRFQIVLRNVTATDEQIENAMTSLKQYGFLNYFGLQRFGTQSVPTYHIGRALLQANWQEAVELILKPRGPGESPHLQEMRQFWWKTRDAGQALKLLQSRNKGIEGQLLYGLIKSHKNDLVSALENIPRNTRLMYLHSYQSYIWNLVLSRRVLEFGLDPVPGDLVLEDDAALLDTADPIILDDEETEQDTDAEASAPIEVSRLPAVRVLTAETVKKYTIHDVVLPLPGHEVTYPDHDAAKWYEELMAKDNLSSASLKQNIRKYTLGGTYRKIAVLPNRVNWRIESYSDATKPLVQSDLEIVQQKTPTEPDPNGTYKALVLDFCLPSSSYATMALREVLKCDTSARHQTTLNSYCAAAAVTPDEELPEKSQDNANNKAESELSATQTKLDTSEVKSDNPSEESKVENTV